VFVSIDVHVAVDFVVWLSFIHGILLLQAVSFIVFSSPYFEQLLKCLLKPGVHIVEEKLCREKWVIDDWRFIHNLLLHWYGLVQHEMKCTVHFVNSLQCCH